MNYSIKRQINWAWNFAKGFHAQIFVYFLLELTSIVFSLLFVYYSKKSVDIALNVIPGDLRLHIFLVVGSVFAGIVAKLIATYINQKTQLKFTLRIQNQIVAKQLNAVWQVLKQWFTGDVMVRITNDCNEVVQMISHAGVNFIVTTLKLIATFIFLWVIDPMLAIMIIAISPLFLFSKIYFKRLRQLNYNVKQSESEVGNIMQENLRNRGLIQSLSIFAARHFIMESAQQNSLGLKLKQLNFNLFTQTMMKVAINVGYLTAFIWGIYRLHQNEITFGTMTAFLQLVGRIQSPILSLITFFPAFIRFRTSADRLMEIDLIEQVETSNNHFAEGINSIRFENVTFAYEHQDVIHKLNVDMKAGEPVAIVGASGKGKTTLIRLLLNLIKPVKGRIILEDKTGDVKDLNSSHKLNFSYVPQGNTLFSGSIYDNLRIINKSITEEQMINALNLACADFVFQLPEGLHTKIGEQSYGLSEGQAQRIAIARAILRDCDIWLFDEATSALDEETSNRLLDNLMKYAKEKIMIFVTHDEKVALRCKKVIQMN
ncbi:ABC transporter ATP-binding protein [Sphingobacterium sp. 1.A.4]|uniref:ABC transporter ATP-binding protein n=1 Tax=Sphingobacterium sp. 1.A.4 TaxID=2044603 RepID=UPI000C0BC3BA|nr:ABC transporter ATP-binding protein [Sphingobacterium sp. 1.A.4]